ncbi:MAG: acetyl-CoA carboxylase, carboxyltransferase subunit beta [Oscillospiraceae bacterium]
MENILNIVKKGLENAGILKNTSETVECPKCKNPEQKNKLVKNRMICPKCGYAMRMDARTRINFISDKNTFKEMFSSVKSKDFLEFPKYKDKLEKAKSDTGENEAVVCGVMRVDGIKCAVFVMDSRFIMASMGSAVGEKITRTFEYASEHHLPVIGFTASGGARMQEGIISLMQMAKVSGAVKAHSEGGNLYITVLTDPTTGGVTASFAMQGDIILAEPKALVGFAGRRVVEQTTKSKLPDDFQSAEFLLAHGFIDKIVPRNEQRRIIATLLKQHDKVGVRK